MGWSPFARHYSGSRGFFPFLRLLRCFSSPACRLLPYGFRQRHTRITTCGFPHSEIPGSMVGQHLPRAYRSRPRPSSALGAKASTVCPSSLDREEHRRFAAMEFSRCARRTCRPPGRFPAGRASTVPGSLPAGAAHPAAIASPRPELAAHPAAIASPRPKLTESLKAQQRTNAEVDVVPGEALARTAEAIVRRPDGRPEGADRRTTARTSRAACRSASSGIPRKEVIQPQLPLRLPCYDFTPVTNPTFGGCLPCGLAHRLRVLPASVV